MEREFCERTRGPEELAAIVRWITPDFPAQRRRQFFDLRFTPNSSGNSLRPPNKNVRNAHGLSLHFP
jgi:hypothetical protein